MEYHKVALVGPEDFDDFGFVDRSLLFLSEMENWPEPWGILSYHYAILDTMGEWFALERNRSFDFARKSELPDRFVLFRKTDDPKTMDWQRRIEATGLPYSVVDCP